MNYKESWLNENNWLDKLTWKGEDQAIFENIPVSKCCDSTFGRKLISSEGTMTWPQRTQRIWSNNNWESILMRADWGKAKWTSQYLNKTFLCYDRKFLTKSKKLQPILYKCHINHSRWRKSQVLICRYPEKGSSLLKDDKNNTAHTLNTETVTYFQTHFHHTSTTSTLT